MSAVETSMVKFAFEGDALDVVRELREDGAVDVWVSVRAVCAGLGVDHPTQWTKLQEKPWATVGLRPTVAEDGKIREQFCIHLRSLPMWLATIEPSRVAEEVRPKLVKYQCEAADALARQFLGPELSAAAGVPPLDTPTARAAIYQRAAESLPRGPARTFALLVAASEASGRPVTPEAEARLAELATPRRRVTSDPPPPIPTPYPPPAGSPPPSRPPAAPEAMGRGVPSPLADKIARWYTHSGRTQFTGRECFFNMKCAGNGLRMDEVNAALDVLVSRGALLRIPAPPRTEPRRGRPQAPTFRVVTSAGA